MRDTREKRKNMDGEVLNAGDASSPLPFLTRFWPAVPVVKTVPLDPGTSSKHTNSLLAVATQHRFTE